MSLEKELADAKHEIAQLLRILDAEAKRQNRNPVCISRVGGIICVQNGIGSGIGIRTPHGEIAEGDCYTFTSITGTDLTVWPADDNSKGVTWKEQA